MSLAGVQCPRLNSVRRAPEGEAEGAAQAQPAAEPFAAQARMFSELRLLQRDITVLPPPSPVCYPIAGCVCICVCLGTVRVVR